MTTMTLGYDNDFVDKLKVDVIVTVESVVSLKKLSSLR